MIKTNVKKGKAMYSEGNEIVLTTNEAIEFLKISKPTYLKLIRTKRIRAIKAGNGWRVLRSELLRFLKGGVNR